jgi:hypothetical protein
MNLYHYTSARGLLGILNDSGLQASSLEHLNDSREFHYACELLRNIWPSDVENRGSTRGGVGAMADQLAISLVSKISFPFVSCFSKDGDRLSQWRAYAAPHGGYSLGFEDSRLVAPGASLVQCVYCEDDQKALIRNEVGVALEELGVAFDAATGEEITAILRRVLALSYSFADLAIRLKHPAFKEECEWRVGIQTNADAVMFRESCGNVVPFTMFLPSGGLQLVELVIGPGPHQDRSAQTARRLLDKYGFSECKCKIRCSRAPFRSW